MAICGPKRWDDSSFQLQIRQNGKRMVRTTRDKLQKSGPVSSSGMVAELNFGFWVNMLLQRHEAMFWQDLHTLFDKLPQNITYSALFSRCDEVREFRNRAFHHEPILHRNITKEYSQIIELESHEGNKGKTLTTQIEKGPHFRGGLSDF